jgi:hypothetical protein
MAGFKTTLNAIREHDPCKIGWSKLLKNLNKSKADDEPLAILTILESNGIDDALWCLRAVKEHQKEMRLFAVACARSVQHLMEDARSIAAIDVAERYARGFATQQELDAARDAANNAARDAANNAARDAARDAASYAASYAASHAASNAAWDAAWGAAWDARGAARDSQANLLILVCNGAFDD